MLKYTRLTVIVGDSPPVFGPSGRDDFFDAKKHLTLWFDGARHWFSGNG